MGMLLKQVQKGKKKFYLDNNLIPLGKNTFFNRCYNGLPTASKYDFPTNKSYTQVCMLYKRNGVISVLGGSGAGKSVIAKRIFSWYKLPEFFGDKYKRPAVIFDYQGDDHRLIEFPNGTKGNNPFPLVFGAEKPTGFGKLVINYTPEYMREDCFFNDIFFGFALDDFHYEDWYSLRIQEASLETLQELIKNNKKMSYDPEEFYRQFKQLQTKAYESEGSGMIVDEKISDGEKRHLRKLLLRLIDENVVTNKKSKVDFINELYSGKVVIFNFHEDETFSPFYMSPIARKLYTWARDNSRKKGHKFLNPILLLEEAQIPLDRTDIALSQGANKWITKYLKQGNKYQNLVILLTQAITEVHKSVRNHAVKQEVLISNPTASDISYFSRIWRPEVINVIKQLRWEEREWALVHSGGNYVETFIANNSMTQIHLR